MIRTHAAVCRLCIERTAYTIGLLCLGWCALTWGRAAFYQRELEVTLDRLVVTPPAQETARPIGPLDLVGQLEVPRLKLSAFVVEGDDESALTAAIGHLPDTPFPWEDGNSGLAAHRDTFFRPLKDIRAGDEIILNTPSGSLDYRVESTLIVKPEDVWVLAPTSRPSMTLITCYPFAYVGHAPQRFIVRAERVTEERGPTIRLLDRTSRRLDQMPRDRDRLAR